MLVAVGRVDVAGARLVRGSSDGTHERRVLHEPHHNDELPLLHVRAHAHGQLGVALEPRLLIYANCHRSSRMIGTSWPVGGDSDHVHFGAADHEVGVHDGVVEAARPAVVRGDVLPAVDALRVREAIRDVARHVLVEKRVEEGDADVGHARVAGDERDLAEAAAPSSEDISPRTTSAPLEAFTSTARPPSKRTSSSRIMAPLSDSGRVERTVPSVRRQSGVV